MSDAAQRLAELKKKLLGSRASSEKPTAPVEAPKQPSPLAQPAPRPLVSPREEPMVDSRRPSLDSQASETARKKQPLTLRALMGQRKKSSLDSSGLVVKGFLAENTSLTTAQEPVIAAPAPSSGSRLKEAPAHRAAGLVAESKSNIIRSKMISLTKDSSSSVADKIAHFEQNPPPGLFQALVGSANVEKASPPLQPVTNHPFAAFMAQPSEPAKKLEIVIPESKPDTPEMKPGKIPIFVPAPIASNSAEVSKFIQERKVWLKRRSREAGLEFTNTKRLKRIPNVVEFLEEHKRFLEALIVIK